MMPKSYHELIQIDSYEDRFNYLKLHGMVGESTFGFNRFVNQSFYTSSEWRSVRSKVIIRDNGCDLGIPERPIIVRIHVHHINPVTMEQLEENDPILFDPDNLICVDPNTHNALHYGDRSLLIPDIVMRKPGDTKLW